MLQLMLHFDATFEAEATDVIAIVVTTMLRLTQAMTTALANQKTALANHVSEELVNKKMLLASLVTKMKMQLKHLYSDVYFAEVEIVETAPVNQRMSLVNHVSVTTAGVEKDVVILTTHLMNQQPMLLFDDSFEEQKNLMTQPRSLVTEPENLALVMIAIVNVKVAKEAVNHEKVKMLPQKHQKMFLNFDVLLDKMDANAARDLAQQFLTESWILLASLEKLFLEKSIELLKPFL